MENSTVLTLQIHSSIEQQYLDEYLPHCTLKWRQGQLLVSLGQEGNQPYISAFESEQQLVRCLKNSPVRLVCLDPTLSEITLQRWADACEQANKPVFLRGTVAQKLPKMTRRQSQFIQQIEQIICWIVAFLLLIVLSPVILATLVVMCIYSPGEILSGQWHIKPQGKLFKLLKFRTTVITDGSRTTTLLGRWMCKYGLDKLPQLLNVLRGEMSLRDSFCPLTISEALPLGAEG